MARRYLSADSFTTALPSFSIDQDVLLTDPVAHLHLFARVISMTMFDGIDDGLFQHQVDAENVLLRIAQLNHETGHRLDNRWHLLG
jgi:hypothetical protein